MNKQVQPKTVTGGKKSKNARLKLLGAEGCRKGLRGASVAPFLGRGFTVLSMPRTPGKPHVTA